ncbi:hypothetical protein EBT16_00975 [bacterium]|nr:hypothetical protein [bacterium]
MRKDPMDPEVYGAAMFINRSEDIRCLNCNVDGFGWLITKNLGYESDQELIARAEAMGYVRSGLNSSPTYSHTDSPRRDIAFPLDDDYYAYKPHPMFPPFEDEEY